MARHDIVVAVRWHPKWTPAHNGLEFLLIRPRRGIQAHSSIHPSIRPSINKATFGWRTHIHTLHTINIHERHPLLEPSTRTHTHTHLANVVRVRLFTGKVCHVPDKHIAASARNNTTMAMAHTHTCAQTYTRHVHTRVCVMLNVNVVVIV